MEQSEHDRLVETLRDEIERLHKKIRNYRGECKRLNRCLKTLRGIYREAARSSLEATCVELGKERDKLRGVLQEVQDGLTPDNNCVGFGCCVCREKALIRAALENNELRAEKDALLGSPRGFIVTKITGGATSGNLGGGGGGGPA